MLIWQVRVAVDLRPKATVSYLWYTGFEDGKYRLQVSQETARSLGVDLRPWGIADIGSGWRIDRSRMTLCDIIAQFLL
jgi:hypothetical protein